ncbi:HAD-like domain-containing protein [Bipolaris maydis]|nr:HAD-like domain-containing protein [Bipolaris maydis]KAJ6203371.1 HAD-like domain-containing protein [Bipolaris maydis]
MALSPTPRALLFDVFGTCVNWRKSIVSALCGKAHESLNAATASLASQLRLRASAMTEEDWGRFAQEWRDSYKIFTKKLATDHSSTWMTVDDHHLKSLKELIAKWELQGLWEEHEIRALSLCWHHLVPWDDSVLGVQLLNQLFATCTLSNGNMSLLSDLRAFTAIPFTHLFSSEMFGTYKPSPEVYLGAVKALGVAPAECVMVAAHLNDLKAAKENGLQTIYVERAGEEDWGDEEIEKARTAGWVDMWVGLGNGNKGFITVAEKLGIAVTKGNEAMRLSSSLPIGMD